MVSAANLPAGVSSPRPQATSPDAKAVSAPLHLAVPACPSAPPPATIAVIAPAQASAAVTPSHPSGTDPASPCTVISCCSRSTSATTGTPTTSVCNIPVAALPCPCALQPVTGPRPSHNTGPTATSA